MRGDVVPDSSPLSSRAHHLEANSHAIAQPAGSIRRVADTVVSRRRKERTSCLAKVTGGGYDPADASPILGALRRAREGRREPGGINDHPFHAFDDRA